MNQWYKKENGFYTLLDDYRKLPLEEWKNNLHEIIATIRKSISGMPETTKKKMQPYLYSLVESQFHHALGMSPFCHLFTRICPRAVSRTGTRDSTSHAKHHERIR